MDLTRTGVGALAAACALTFLLAACGDDDDSADTSADETEQADGTEAEETTSTEAADDDGTATTEADGGSTTTTDVDDGDDDAGDGTEGDPDAVALAQRINLTIDDFADGWTESPASDDDGGADLDDCFTETDIEAATVGEAETGTFSFEAGEQTGQLVTMQTVVLDSADTASALLSEAAGEAFIACSQDLFTSGFGEGATASIAVLPDDPPYTEESFGLAGDLTLASPAGETVNGAMDLHLFRTGEVVSFTATLDLGDVGLEATLGELYPVIADRHATELG